jgi:hypothetical protein
MLGGVVRDRAADIALAKELGHGTLQMAPTKSGRRFWLTCSCGWGTFDNLGRPTVTRATEAEAVRGLVTHLEKALQVHRQRLLRDGAARPVENVRAVR